MQVWRAAARELVKDNVAIVRSDDGRRVTYRELKEASVAYAADWAGAFGFDVGGSLEERGRGKAVGVMALPGAEYCAAMLAVWRLGWIAVPLSPSHPIGELTHAIREAKIEVIFVTDNLIDKVANLESPSCHVRRLRDIDDVPRDRDAASRDDLTASPEPEPDDGALVIFTSGTTGAPKAALHTHASLAAQIDSLTKAWGWSCEDKILHALPLNHVHGIVNAWMCAHANGAQVTFCAKFSATQWWRIVVDWKQNPTTLFMGVPTMYVRLIQAYDAVTSEERRAEMSAAASRLRLCVSGSAAMPVPVAKRWSEIAGGNELLERYGATEIGMALSQPLRGRRVPGRVGHPLPGVEVKIVDGELRVKGPGVFGGYVGVYPGFECRMHRFDLGDESWHAVARHFRTDLRVFAHDAIHAHHDKDIRCLATFPISRSWLWGVVSITGSPIVSTPLSRRAPTFAAFWSTASITFGSE